MMKRPGFTLIELAVVLAFAGLMTSAGLILLPRLWHEKQRIDNQKYLLAAKEALLTYATNYNALPVPDDPDLLATTPLKLKQRDPFDRPLRYIVNPNLLLGADKTLPCATLNGYFANGTTTDFPLLWQHGLPEVATASLPVAAVLISRGADGELDKYFAADGETIVGDNSTDNLAINFVQAPASKAFDDQLVYLTIPELINALPECRQ